MRPTSLKRVFDVHVPHTYLTGELTYVYVLCIWYLSLSAP